MARNINIIKSKKNAKKAKIDLNNSMIEREYWDTMELKDPITGKIKKHRVKVVRYKHKYASLDDIEETDDLVERLSSVKKPVIDVYEE